MIITFVGHGSVCYGEDIFQKVIRAVKENVQPGERVSFYCGGYGNFDHLCARACRKIITEGSKSTIIPIQAICFAAIAETICLP